MATKKAKERRKRKKTNAQEWAKQKASGGISCVRLPEGVEFYSLELGKHVVDFMTFIAGKGNPRADEGYEHFEREYATHDVEMPSGFQRIPCLYQTFSQPCYICDWMKRSGDPETNKKVRAKTRHLWLINDKPGNDKNFKVLDSNEWNRGMGFGELMVNEINRDPSHVEFADPVEGMSVQLTVIEQTMGSGKKYNSVSDITFLPRRHSYSEDVVDRAPCLDDMLIPLAPMDIRSKPVSEYDKDDWKACYKEMERVFMQTADEDDSDTSTDNGQAVSQDEDEEPVTYSKGDVVMHDTYGECTVAKVSSNGVYSVEDAKGKYHRALADEMSLVEDPDDDDDDLDLDDDDDDSEVEETPKAKVKAKSGKKKVKAEEEAEEDDDLDEDDEDEDEDDSEIEEDEEEDEDDDWDGWDDDEDEEDELEEEEPPKKTNKKATAKKPAGKKTRK